MGAHPWPRGWECLGDEKGRDPAIRAGRPDAQSRPPARPPALLRQRRLGTGLPAGERDPQAPSARL